MINEGDIFNNRLWEVSLLRLNLHPTEKQILSGLEQNFCRCGAHIRIVRAVQQAAAEMKGAQK